MECDGMGSYGAAFTQCDREVILHHTLVGLERRYGSWIAQHGDSSIKYWDLYSFLFDK
jgi:hypothetical protein